MPRSRSRSSGRRDDDEDDRRRRKSSKRSRRSRSPSPSRGDEEKLLQRAKDFIAQEKRRQKSGRRSRSRSPTSDVDERSRKRHRRDDSVRDDRKKSSKRRHSASSDDDDKSEDRRRRKHKHSSHSSRSKGKRDETNRDRKRSSRRYSSNEESSSDSRDRKKRDKDRAKRKHSKHQKEHKQRKKDDKKDKKKKEHKGENDEIKGSFNPQKPDKKNLVSLGDPLGKPPATLLEADRDYFTFHQHLWIWLYREEGLAFNDLTSKETHEAFARFVKQYNAGLLEAAYYDEKGLPPQAMEESKTTRHKWTFQTSETERKGLQLLQDGVRKLTEYSDDKEAGKGSTRDKFAPAGSKTSAVAPRPAHHDDDNNDRRRPWTAEERAAHRAANKRLKEHVRTAEEEFSGGSKDYGRERQLEKKRQTADKIHGAARDRDDMGVALSDDALYGDGGHGASFQAALARERKRKAQREESKQARIQELQQKEQNKQQAMLEMLGLSGIAPGQKITIAPRTDDPQSSSKK